MDNKTEPKTSYMLSSVKNALLILNSFTNEHPEWGIRDLAKHMQVTHSTVQRLLITLASEGYVVQDPATKKFRLGIRLLGFSNIIIKHLEIHKEALPILNQLVQKTGETVHIGVLEGTNVVYLHKVEPLRPIRVFTEIGKSVPCYCLAAGKAILAYQDDRLIEKVIQDGLVPYTKKTITDPVFLRNHLKQIKEQGYATSQGEFLKDGEIFSVAAPIYDYTGKVFASLSLIGIAQWINENTKQKYTEQVKKAAHEISRKLGY